MKKRPGRPGSIAYLVAPGTYHFLHMASAQAAFPTAETFICPGAERKCPGLAFDWLLAIPRRRLAWPARSGSGARAAVGSGKKIISWDTRTLLLVDLVENFTDRTPGRQLGTETLVEGCVPYVEQPEASAGVSVGMARQAGGAGNRCVIFCSGAFERVIVAHGDLIEADAQQRVERAWKVPLTDEQANREPIT